MTYAQPSSSFLPLNQAELAEASTIRDAYRAEFDFLDAVIELVTKYVSQADIKSHEAEKMIVSAIMFRAIEASRSATLLAVIGLTADASVACRTLLEALAKLGSAAEDPSFVKQYAQSSLADRLRLHNALRSNPAHTSLSDDTKYEELKRELETSDAERLPPVEQLLAKAGLKSSYIAYRVHSVDAHVAPYSLERYYTKDEDGQVVGLKQYPHINEVPFVVMSTAIQLLASLVAWAQVCGLSIVEQLEFETRLNELAARQKSPCMDKERKV